MKTATEAEKIEIGKIIRKIGEATRNDDPDLVFQALLLLGSNPSSNPNLWSWDKEKSK
jgi:hypothetical protein